MNVTGIAAVEARMNAIDARFGHHQGVRAPLGKDLLAAPAPASPSAPSTGSVRSFAEVYDPMIGASSPGGTVSTGSATGAPAPTGASGPALTGSVPPSVPYAQRFEAEGAEHGVPPRLLAAVGWVESNYTPDVVSPAGAIGLMQLMPATADALGVDPWDPAQAIDGAARVLAIHHERFGSWDLALAAYHSGGGAVSRAGNTAPPRAAEYVRRIHERLEQV